MNRFRFVGKLGLNPADSKMPYKREGVTSNGDKYVSFSCLSKPEKNNTAFCEVYGTVTDKINTIDVNGNKITIPWDQRSDDSWLKTVAFFKQRVIKFNGEKHTFITDYDFGKYLCNNASLIKDKNFIIMGQISANEYKGDISQKFSITSMYEVENDEKPGFEVDFDYTWRASSIDIEDWGENKTININGYINQYINSTIKNKYILRPVIFDASKLDFTDDSHVEALNMKLKQIGLEYTNGTIKSKIKKDAVCKLPIRCRMINGAEQIEFDESQLSENQKKMIACGLMSLEDFKPKGTIYGERKTTYKLFGFDLRDDYADGYVIIKDIAADEFDELIYTPTKTSDKKESKATTESKPTSDNGVDLDDLFN